MSLGPASERRQREAGFTLVEMLAAFVILGAMAAVAVPRLQQWYEGMEQRIRMAEAMDSVKRLHTRAILLGQSYDLTPKTARLPLADGKPALTLPKGWDLAKEAALRVPSTGVCVSSSINMLAASGAIVRVTVDGPSCRVSGGYLLAP